MTIKELIEQLSQYDENTEVLLEEQDSGGTYNEALTPFIREGTYNALTNSVDVDDGDLPSKYYIADNKIRQNNIPIIIL